MRVYISIDMEGVAGIATREQVTRGHETYPAAAALMTAEANAAIAGAYDAGADEVVVNDAHGDMWNLLPEALDERAEVVLGSPKVPTSMLAGMAEGDDLALFVGYHAAAGASSGVLSHTYSSAAFYEVRLDGHAVTEAEINARVAAGYGVPVALVTGDDAACAGAGKLPGVLTVAVKSALGFTVTRSLHPARARELIRAGAAQVVTAHRRGNPAALAPSGACALEVDLLSPTMADLCLLVPGAYRLGGRSVGFQAHSAAEMFQVLLAWVYLSRPR